MKIFKIVAILVVLVLAIGAGIAYYVASNLDSIIKDAVETHGPSITGTPVKLKSVKVDLPKGSARLAGFSVGNIESFEKPTLFSFDEIALDIDIAKLTDKIVVIEEVLVGGINITAEQKDLTTNIQALLKRLSSDEKPAQNDKPSKPLDIKIAIERLVFNEGVINLVTEKYGEHALTIPSFRLSDIGDPNIGLSPEALGGAILKPLLRQAEKAAKTRIEDIAKEKAKDKLKNKLQEKLDAKLSKEKQDELKGKLEGVKGLFGR